MFIYIVIVIALVSVLLALWELKKQNRIEELRLAKKSLKRGKVIYHKDSSSSG